MGSRFVFAGCEPTFEKKKRFVLRFVPSTFYFLKPERVVKVDLYVCKRFPRNGVCIAADRQDASFKVTSHRPQNILNCCQRKSVIDHIL